jgi:hypothetical protein
MNLWGVEGCREHFQEIVQLLKHEERQANWAEWLRAGAKATTIGIFSIEDLVNEAIRRAEVKLCNSAES